MNRDILFNMRGTANFSNIKNEVKALQKDFNKLKLPEVQSKKGASLFSKLTDELKTYQNYLNSGFKKKGDVTGFENSGKRIIKIFDQLQDLQDDINFKDALKFDDSEIKKLSTELTELERKIKNQQKTFKNAVSVKVDKDGKKEIIEIDKQLQILSKYSKGKPILELKNLINSGEIEQAKQKINEVQAYLIDTFSKKTKKPEAIKEMQEAIDAIKLALPGIDTSKFSKLAKELSEGKIEAKELDNKINELVMTETSRLVNGFTNVRKEIEDSNQELNDFAESAQKSAAQLNELKSRAEYFFGIAGAARLARQAIRQLWQETQELDKSMTETAVVTDFTVGDMWDKLPEYTKNAKALGVATKELYDATTLYYQQGLKGNDVMNIGVETLKLARIASLEASQATDLMTTALRGFNMEISQTSAQNISDTYAALAASSASNVQELATAMSKTASLAASVGADFKNIAVFLAQGIETTRESADTVGTAMKTVLARFNEMKKDPAEIMDVEGEEVNVNKVEAALRSAGIALRDTNGQFREADKVLLDVAEKWNTLDTMTQRYIATQAAGSRQQSRFIAMMSDYNRTLELQAVALNSNGAAEKQFEKTQESLQTKTQRLKDTWQEFILGLANSDTIKGVVDILEKLLSTINKMSSLSGIWGSISKGLLAFGSFKGGKLLVNKLIAGFSEAKKVAADGGKDVIKAFTDGFIGNSDKFSKKARNLLKDSSLFEASGQVKGIQNLKNEYSELINVEMARAALEKEGISLNELFANSQRTLITETTALKEISAKMASVYKLEGEQSENAAIWTALGATEDQAAALAKKGVTVESIQKSLSINLEEKATEKNVKEINEETLAEGLSAVSKGEVAKASAMRAAATTSETAAIAKKTAAEKLSAIATKLSSITAKGLKDSLTGLIASIKNVASSAVSAFIEIQIAGGPILWLIEAIVAAVVAIGASVYVWNKWLSPLAQATKELENAKEATKAASDAANEAKEEYSDLIDKLDQLKEKQSSFEGLLKGTEEWDNAIQDINSDILELIENYKELASFVEMDENGKLTINYSKVVGGQNAQAVIDDYSKKNIQATLEETAAKQYELQKSENVERRRLTDSVFAAISDEMIDKMAKALATGEIILKGDDIETDIKQLENLDEFGLTSLFAITYDDIDALKEFGNTLLQNAETNKTYNDIISKDITDIANIGDKYTELEKQRMIAYQSRYDIKDKAQQLADSYGFLGNKIDDKDYEDFFKRIYGDSTEISFGKVKKDGKVILSKDAAKYQYALSKTTDEAVKNMQAFADGLKNLSGNIKEPFEKLFNDKEGKQLTQTDINAIDINKIVELWNNNFKDTGAFENFKDFRTTITDIRNAAQVMITDAKNSINALSQELISNFNDIFNNLNAGQIKGLSDQIIKVFAFSGKEGANSLMTSYQNILDSLSTQELKDKFIDEFNKIDLSDMDAIQQLSDNLETLGVHIPTDKISKFENELIQLAGAVKKVNLENLKKQIQSMQELISDINGKDFNDRSFTQEDAEKLIQYSGGAISANDFTGLGDDLVYVGDSVQDLIPILKERMAQEIREQNKQLKSDIKSGEIIQKEIDKQKENGASQNEMLWNPAQQIDFLRKIGFENSGLSNETLSLIASKWDTRNNEWVKGTDAAFTTMLTDAFTNAIVKASEVESNKVALAMGNQQLGTIEYSDRAASDIGKDAQSGDEIVNQKATAALKDRMARTGEMENQIRQLNSAEDKYATAVEKLNKLYDKNGNLVNDATKDQEKLAKAEVQSTKAALNHEKAESAKTLALIELQGTINDLQKDTEDYWEILEQFPKGSEEYANALNQIVAAAQDYLGADLGEIFAEDAGKIEEFKKALANGPQAVTDFLNSLDNSKLYGFADSTDAVTQAFEDVTGTALNDQAILNDIVNQLDGLEFDIDGNADFTQIFNAILAVVHDVNQAQQILEQLAGTKVSFTLKKDTMKFSQKVDQIVSARNAQSGAGGAYTDSGSEQRGVNSGTTKLSTRSTVEMEYISEVTGTLTRGNGGGGGGYKPSGNKGSGGGGGGGGGGDDKVAEPEHDPYYMINQAIEKQQVKKNKLEDEFNDLLEEGAYNLDEIAKLNEKRVKTIEKQIELEKERRKIAYKERNDWIEKNKDLKDYVSYDMATNTVIRNDEAIMGITDADLLEKVNTALENAEDIQSHILDSNENIYNYEREIAEITKSITPDLSENYNILAKYESLQEHINLLQEEYNRLVESQYSTVQDIYKAWEDQYEALKKQLKLAKEVAEASQESASKTYEKLGISITQIDGYAEGKNNKVFSANGKDSLTGENGPELVETDKGATLVGIDGPEIVPIADDDVVYTAEQTEEILGNSGKKEKKLPKYAGGKNDNIADQVIDVLKDSDGWQTVQIDYSAILEYPQDVQQQILQAIDVVEKAAKQNNDAIKGMRDASNAIRQFVRDTQDKASDFFNKVKDLIVKEYQKQIDALSAANSAASTSDSDLISAIQNSISQQRQDRANEQTESNIADDEKRLAFLMADTSGGNAAEIAELQKKIEEEKENYTDTLIDQKISELEMQNDEAAAQRQAQIDLLQAQLEMNQENGVINAETQQEIDAAVVNINDQLLALGQHMVDLGIISQEQLDQAAAEGSLNELIGANFDNLSIADQQAFLGVLDGLGLLTDEQKAQAAALDQSIAGMTSILAEATGGTTYAVMALAEAGQHLSPEEQDAFNQWNESLNAMGTVMGDATGATKLAILENSEVSQYLSEEEIAKLQELKAGLGDMSSVLSEASNGTKLAVLDMAAKADYLSPEEKQKYDELVGGLTDMGSVMGEATDGTKYEIMKMAENAGYLSEDQIAQMEVIDEYIDAVGEGVNQSSIESRLKMAEMLEQNGALSADELAQLQAEKDAIDAVQNGILNSGQETQDAIAAQMVEAGVLSEAEIEEARANGTLAQILADNATKLSVDQFAGLEETLMDDPSLKPEDKELLTGAFDTLTSDQGILQDIGSRTEDLTLDQVNAMNEILQGDAVVPPDLKTEISDAGLSAKAASEELFKSLEDPNFIANFNEGEIDKIQDLIDKDPELTDEQKKTFADGADKVKDIAPDLYEKLADPNFIANFNEDEINKIQELVDRDPELTDEQKNTFAEGADKVKEIAPDLFGKLEDPGFIANFNEGTVDKIQDLLSQDTQLSANEVGAFAIAADNALQIAPKISDIVNDQGFISRFNSEEIDKLNQIVQKDTKLSDTDKQTFSSYVDTITGPDSVLKTVQDNVKDAKDGIYTNPNSKLAKLLDKYIIESGKNDIEAEREKEADKEGQAAILGLGQIMEEQLLFEKATRGSEISRELLKSSAQLKSWESESELKALLSEAKNLLGLTQEIAIQSKTTEEGKTVYYVNATGAGKVYQGASQFWQQVEDTGIGDALGVDTEKIKRMYGFATGGLAKATGPAWLDGTIAKPELVLNPTDTENFIELKDILSDILNGTGSINQSENNGDTYFEIHIDVEKIASDYDVDSMIEEIKRVISRDASYRSNNFLSR